MLMRQLERGKMPPEGPPLTPQQLTTIRRWIDAGGRRSGEDAETARQQIAALSISEQEVFVNVFFTNCLDCHGKWKQEGGLDLRTRASRSRAARVDRGLSPVIPPPASSTSVFWQMKCLRPKTFSETSSMSPEFVCKTGRRCANGLPQAPCRPTRSRAGKIPY